MLFFQDFLHSLPPEFKNSFKEAVKGNDENNNSFTKNFRDDLKEKVDRLRKVMRAELAVPIPDSPTCPSIDDDYDKLKEFVLLLVLPCVEVKGINGEESQES